MIPKRWFVTLVILPAWLMLSHAHVAQAQDQAESALTTADSMRTANKHLSFGNNYFKNGQYKDAETQFLRAWDFNPTKATTTRYLGRLYKQIENYDEAIKWFNKAIELEPTGKYTKGVYVDLAGIYVLQEKTDEAIASYESLLGFEVEPEEEIGYLHGLVSLHANNQDLEKALEYAKRWGELAPEDPQVMEMISKLHLHTGGEAEAIAEYEKMLEMNPSDNMTREKLAGLYQTQGSTEKAFEAYEILHKSDPKNYFFLEKTLDLGKKLGKSKSFLIDRLETLHDLQPNNLATIEQLSDLTNNLKWVNLGLKKDTRNGKYPYMMGDYFYDKWKNTSAPQDSIESLNWFKKAQNDPQWSGNAKAMIQTLDPPLTEEEKKRREFFDQSKKKKQEVQQEGKK